jgi:hypothetical protein
MSTGVLDAYLDSYKRPAGFVDGEARCDRCIERPPAPIFEFPHDIATWTAQEQQNQSVAQQVQLI